MTMDRGTAMKVKNKGIIEVSDIMLMDNSKELLTGMAEVGFIPISIVDTRRDTYEFKGLCDKFSDVKEGDSLPRYQIVFCGHDYEISYRLVSVET